MADLVRDDVAQQFARQLGRQRQFARAWIERTDLGEVPGLHQTQHVVPEDGVRGDHLAAARVDHRRAHRVLPAAGRPAHHVVAHVLRVPVRILLRCRRIARDDGVAKARVLEHLLPVLDAALDVRAPLVRHFRGSCRTRSASPVPRVLPQDPFFPAGSAGCMRGAPCRVRRCRSRRKAR